MRGRLRRRGGFILAVSIALLFIMMALALGLAQQGRSLQGFAAIVEAESVAAEAAEAGSTQMAAILQGNADASTMGLPSSIPSDGGGTAAFHQPSNVSTSLNGCFNDHSKTESVLRRQPGPSGFVEADGFEDFATAAGTLRVPSRSALVQTTGTVPGKVRCTWMSVYSSNIPWGMLAPNGAITLAEARSSSTVDGADGDESGEPVRMCAHDGITVSGFVNGRARTLQGDVSLGQGGIAQKGQAVVPVPADFCAALSAVRSSAQTGLTDQGALLASLPQYQQDNDDWDDDDRQTYNCDPGERIVSQRNFGCKRGTRIGNMHGSWDDRGGSWHHNDTHGRGDDRDDNRHSGDSRGSSASYSLGGPMVIESGQSVKAPGSLTLAADLVLKDHTVLYVQGDLDLVGSIYMDQFSTLVVDGTVSVGGSIALSYQPAASKGITSSVIAGGDVEIENGITMTNGLQASTGGDVTQVNPGNPYRDSIVTCSRGEGPGAVTIHHYIPNPKGMFYTEKCGHWLKVCPKNANQIVGSVTRTGPMAIDGGTPGALVYTEGAMHIGGDKACGLFVANGDVNIDCPRLVGAVWSRNGDIVAPDTKWRWYPYFTHAFVHSAGGETHVEARSYHRTAYGKVGAK